LQRDALQVLLFDWGECAAQRSLFPRGAVWWHSSNP